MNNLHAISSWLMLEYLAYLRPVVLDKCPAEDRTAGSAVGATDTMINDRL